MSAIVTVLHVIACIFLIAVVLLQRGKGAQIGAVFGGGAGATLFGSRGAGNFLTKLTAIAAFIFMATSLGLSYFGLSGGSDRLFQDGAATEKKAAEGSLFEEVGEAPAQAPAAEGAAPEQTPPAAEAAPANPDAAPAPAPTPDAG
jgi:preprotein translocase subunit SecG